MRSWIIPARAGFTISRPEYLLRFPGSSPLARGLRDVLGRLVTRPGIIPARAGFTSSHLWIRNRLQDHPRSRGVYFRTSILLASIIGSSPLARGLLTCARMRRLQIWIIPARAGFTYRHAGPAPPLRDHPRSRGVYASARLWVCRSRGSSPLARGLPWAHESDFDTAGIIPARAGFTATLAQVEASGKDHPRSRGVYVMKNAIEKGEEGSSPLARGLPRRRRRPSSASGIIPARAGFT